MATVVLDEVCKRYESHIILQNISLTVEKGEFVVVVGPSGCGKSTLLRLVSGLEQLSGGKVLINDRCVNSIPPPDRDMAMVFQSYALYPHMSVYENMAYALKIRKLPKKEIQQRVIDAAALLKIGPYLRRKPGELSGGQKQRVAMGRAMVRSPSVFLFDEPLSNLDAKLRGEMRYEIKKLHRKLNTTFLYVTHDQTEAMTMADKVLILNEGKVEQMGAPSEVYLKPASLFVAGFIGQHAINTMSAKLDEDGKTVFFGKNSRIILGDLSNEKFSRQVTLAIRPEHIQISNQASTIRGIVKFVEDMGADKLLRLYSSELDNILHVRVPGDYPITDAELNLHFLVDKMHIFDGETGVRLEERS